MICFCYFCKKQLFFVLGVAHGDPSFAQVGPKNSNFQRFQQNIFRTTGFQLKLLILIEYPNIFHQKPAKKIKMCVLGQNLGQIRSNVVNKVNRGYQQVLFILYLGNTFKSKKQWLYKPQSGNLRQLKLEMPHFEDVRAKFLPDQGQKCQKTDYFQEFHFSQLVLKSQN